ncbi:phospholipid-binding lipoprotein MlaA [Variovorax sp. 54]|uniref:MlaA family lipoprotein n=1 Tax=Variovorax sp. 54 TaxID=2035212 RepID=UPI000C18F171|nr:VacJ family lipoprotein [Variovorax sp. 54]PIF76940.1 phospholipid-binding lipoprotein MlaA [Variovorax sp. 54]
MTTRLFSSHAIKSVARPARWATAAACLALVAGCATGPGASPVDPFEPFNRGVTRFNDTVDEAVLEPVASTYQKVVPSLVRQGVTNFFSNIGDVWSLANNVAQLKLQNSAETFMRLNVNTFFGLGGLLDVATEARLPRHEEDFGQTLGYWGVGAGPYIVLPLLGPSTLRDTVAKPLELYGDAQGYIHDVAWRNSLSALRVVDTRSRYLGATRLLDEAALDKYSFTRDAFLQRRRNQVYDGNPPDDDNAGK